MRRFLSLLFGATAGLVFACTDHEVVVIKADAAAPATKDAGKQVQPPDGTETDSGIVGRRLGDKGCKDDTDCDSGFCFLASSETDNFCTLRCTKENAKEICVPPLTGECSRSLVCVPAE